MFICHLQEVDQAIFQRGIDKAPVSPERVAEKRHFAIPQL